MAAEAGGTARAGAGVDTSELFAAVRNASFLVHVSLRMSPRDWLIEDVTFVRVEALKPAFAGCPRWHLDCVVTHVRRYSEIISVQ